MAEIEVKVPKGFSHPTSVPANDDEFRQWQQANREWWEAHPMRYDRNERIKQNEFSREFYTEIDHRFFSAAAEYMDWNKIPFDSLIDFDSLRDKDVLEIGVGSGCHAQLLARHAGSFSGIDLTDYAVKAASERLRLFGLNGRILRMEAERMNFDDGQFDFVWSWGVIHHCADPRKALQEINRVLRPDGIAVMMVYHRNFWNYYVCGGLLHGLVQGDLFKAKSLHRAIQQRRDGAFARFYSISEWRTLVRPYFNVDRISVFGCKSEIVPIPSGRIKNAMMGLIPNRVSRFLTNRCRLGSYLVSVLRKGN